MWAAHAGDCASAAQSEAPTRHSADGPDAEARTAHGPTQTHGQARDATGRERAAAGQGLGGSWGRGFSSG